MSVTPLRSELWNVCNSELESIPVAAPHDWNEKCE